MKSVKTPTQEIEEDRSLRFFHNDALLLFIGKLDIIMKWSIDPTQKVLIVKHSHLHKLLLKYP